MGSTLGQLKLRTRQDASAFCRGHKDHLCSLERIEPDEIQSIQKKSSIEDLWLGVLPSHRSFDG